MTERLARYMITKADWIGYNGVILVTESLELAFYFWEKVNVQRQLN